MTITLRNFNGHPIKVQVSEVKHIPTSRYIPKTVKVYTMDRVSLEEMRAMSKFYGKLFNTALVSIIRE